MNNDPYVTYDVDDKVGIVEFFHPAHNSLPGNILSELVSKIELAGLDQKTSVILLKSGGDRTFCAGASFNELAAVKDKASGESFFMGFANVINAIRKCPKLVIGRVQGKAVGGGVGIAAACDYSIATKFASVRLSELAVGIGPFVIGPAVQRKIGLSAFSQMAINASEWQTAAWAKNKGLFTEAFVSTEKMDEYIKIFLNQLSNYNPAALYGLKKIFWEGTENWDDLLRKRAKMSGEMVLSTHAKEAINKFLKA